MDLMNFKEKMPNIINDPFLKDKIQEVSITFGKGFLTGQWKARGYVRFGNGNTSGEQSFNGNDFNEVLFKVKTFIENLK